MNSRIRKLTTWTISDLSRLMSPPSWPPSLAAHAAAGRDERQRDAEAHEDDDPSQVMLTHSAVSSITRCQTKVCENYHSIAPGVNRPGRSGRVRDDPAPDHDVAVVEDDRLARADRPLRRVEDHLAPGLPRGRARSPAAGR